MNEDGEGDCGPSAEQRQGILRSTGSQITSVFWTRTQRRSRRRRSKLPRLFYCSTSPTLEKMCGMECGRPLS